MKSIYSFVIRRDLFRVSKSSPNFLRRGAPGFALVVTLALMVLLILLAVGLLSLSSIELRSMGQGSAMARAKANARMAMMIAMGELQKHAGPDQRITARADIRQTDSRTIANPRLTGVWNSWEIDPNAPPSPADFEEVTRDKKFLGWLVSSVDAAEALKIGFADAEPTSPVVLWDEGTLGQNPNQNDLVRAGKVPINDEGSKGAYAWAVMDEGVKVRVNTPYRESGLTVGARSSELGAGQRPGTDFISGLESAERVYFKENSSSFAKLVNGITPQTFQYAADVVAPAKGGTKMSETLKKLTHDVTPWATGIFTDTARGGLKQDFHLLNNQANLPSEYTNKGIYASVLNMATSEVPSDPTWNSLHELSRLYLSKVTKENGAPLLKSSVPPNWSAADGIGTTGFVANSVTLNLAPPPGLLLMPVIDKVQMLFSLVARDYYRYSQGASVDATSTASTTAMPTLHPPQADHFRGTAYVYGLDLLYTPIITLHNPYNVSMEFENLKVEFFHVPFAAQVFRDGARQATELVPLDKMHRDSELGDVSQGFTMNLKTEGASGAPGSGLFRLLPGETKLFSPYIDPNRTWENEWTGSTKVFADLDLKSSKTRALQGMPGWRGKGIGFDLDWWNAKAYVTPNTAVNGRWSGCIAVKKNSQLYIKFAPLSVPTLSKNKFTVTMSAQTAGSSVPTVVSAVEIDYENPTGLQTSLESHLDTDKTLRFPKSGTVRADTLFDHATVPIKSLSGPLPFALLSVQSKTTRGGEGDKKDGPWATKPWAFGHSGSGATTGKVVSGHAANNAYEFDIQRLDMTTGIDQLINVSPSGRSNSITGNTSTNGVKFGVRYDVPLAPLQSFASLNSANPGGSSGYLPRFAQPIGNSWAHPQLAPDKLKVSTALDHSFLLNLALYDRFYFSGLANQTGAFASNRSTDELAESFADGKGLDDPRLLFRIPDEKQAGNLPEEIAADDGYRKIAAWQLMQGAFNINSTSVNAWKAMLASVHNSKAIINQVDLASATGSSSSVVDLPELVTTGTDKKVRISRFRLPVSPSSAEATNDEEEKTFYWLGAREYSDGELQTLAEKIVEQVRKRGPFLSMAEFVNRRLGSDEMAQRGALQQAIDDANINIATATTARAGYEITADAVKDYGFANPKAGAGSSYQGAPGYLTQADLLSVLGNAATARSDTFTIRGYGEAHDPSGKVLAKATCEAVVQRFPEWVDGVDKVETNPADLTSTANKNFGRRMQIISFRWLDDEEI